MERFSSYLRLTVVAYIFVGVLVRPATGQTCGVKCAVCNSTTCITCISAADGPAVTPARSCKPCTPNCRSCAKSGAGKCDANFCNPGFRLTGTTCTACTLADCQACNLGPCTICMSGFYLVNGPPQQCLPCGPHCTFCNSHPGQCDSDYCLTGMGITPTFDCDVCAEGCTRCNTNHAYLCDPGRCTAAYTFNAATKLCDLITTTTVSPTTQPATTV